MGITAGVAGLLVPAGADCSHRWAYPHPTFFRQGGHKRQLSAFSPVAKTGRLSPRGSRLFRQTGGALFSSTSPGISFGTCHGRLLGCPGLCWNREPFKTSRWHTDTPRPLAPGAALGVQDHLSGEQVSFAPPTAGQWTLELQSPQVQRNGLRTSNALASRARRAILPRGGWTAALDASQVPPETSGPLAALRSPSGRSVAGSDRPSLMASKKLRPACGGGTEPSILQPLRIATHGWRRADGT